MFLTISSGRVEDAEFNLKRKRVSVNRPNFVRVT
jgi:hypothetical protein